MPSSALYAFGFTSLPMLGWMAAAAAPILIHLWSRRKYREMTWAAMEYLLAALKRKQRRMQFEQWLLLAVRTLLILLIIAAVAEPYLERIGLAAIGGGRTHRVLVIDGSYSMAYQPKDKSRFQQAKLLAQQIVEESRQGDAFTLVLMSSPPRVVVGNPVFDPGEFLQEIESLRLEHTTVDLPATVAGVERILKTARREHARLKAEEVYFLTDLDRAGWLPKHPSNAAAEEFRKRARRLAESAVLVIIDLGQPAAENVAVTAVETPQPVVTLARDFEIEASLRNFGHQSRTRQPVELLVDGRIVGEQQVDLPPDGEVSVAFVHRFETPGDHAVEIRTHGDYLDVDNHRFMAVPVRESIPVLCIDGHPSGEAYRGATDYLAVALTPQDESAERPVVRAEVAAESALLERDFSRYECVFLCDVAQFTSSEARRLDAYLRGGGNLVVFLGPQVMADRYNRELGGRAGGPRLLPARLGPVVTQTALQPLNPLDYRHPIVRAFAKHPGAGLLEMPVAKYFKLTLPTDSKAKVALATAGGDPLIVEEPIGRGRVVLVATSA
ncbi:MAG: VWA domain-containing protein, partial [Candidatus Nealsonbacteria bacterium]|nr:VWA domain-containing protein [Candidatus Nealsonbacteria bacterium]